jgi:hypothetical protein
VWYAYYLMRATRQSCELPLLFQLLYDEEERRKKVKSYETAVPLNGEPKRDRKGTYSWRKFGADPVTAT